MQVRVPAHDRTVHPDLARAALLGVRRHGPTAAAGLVGRLLDAGDPVPERLHRSLLAELTGHGWPAFVGAAEHLLDRPREGDIAEVIERGSLPELVALLPTLQLAYHVGHTTDLRLDGGRLTAVHRALVGTPPSPAESLFTAAIHTVLVGACAGRRPTVSLRFTDGGHVPTSPAAEGPHGGQAHRGRRVEGWRIEIAAEPVTAVPPSTGVRQLVSADPARRWRLDAVAARSAVSTRSLQRALADEGTGFRDLVTSTRLGIAHGLVRRTDLGLAEIAAACGFTDHAHLTRCFSAHYGLAPSVLRANPSP